MSTHRNKSTNRHTQDMERAKLLIGIQIQIQNDNDDDSTTVSMARPLTFVYSPVRSFPENVDIHKISIYELINTFAKPHPPSKFNFKLNNPYCLLAAGATPWRCGPEKGLLDWSVYVRLRVSGFTLG